MRPVFFLRHYNDVDHVAPVIWRCLEDGDDVLVVLLDRTYPAASDDRLALLRDYDNASFYWIDEFLGIDWAEPMFHLAEKDGRAPARPTFRYLRRGLRASGLSIRWARRALRTHDVTACVFEWGPPHRPSHAELFEAATELNLPTICLPHGLNIYTNMDIKPDRAAAVGDGKDIMASRNEYDAYVSQSQYHREQDIRFGVDPEIYHVLGSARYYPEWQSINENLHDTFTPSGGDEDKLNVVFMLPHWEYNVDEQTTLELVSDLVDEDWVYFAVKEHTRGDSLPSRLDRQIAEADDAESIADVPSVSLIKWADAVINFGSSIGIEAFLQETPHVNPSYLHTNTTIFDETGAGYLPESNHETMELLRNIHVENHQVHAEYSPAELFSETIYGGNDEYDVLGVYRDLMATLSDT